MQKVRQRTCSPRDRECPPSFALLRTVPSSRGTRPHAVGAPLTGRNPKSISVVSLRPSGSIFGITTLANLAPAIRFSRKEDILVSSTRCHSARFSPWTPSRIKLRSRAGISRTCARTATAILTRPTCGFPSLCASWQCLAVGVALHIIRTSMPQSWPFTLPMAPRSTPLLSIATTKVTGKRNYNAGHRRENCAQV